MPAKVQAKCIFVILEVTMIRQIVLPVFNRDEFKRQLHMERFRADREGTIFSVIFIYLNEKCDLEPVVSTLQQRLRKIDIMGSVDDRCMALLLPFTDTVQAAALCESVIMRSGLHDNIRSARAYTYPHVWFLKGNAFESDEYEADSTQLPEQEEEVLSATVARIPFWKRVFDIIVSGTLILLASPLLLLVTLYIKMVSKGPVFFIQKRVGYKGRLFDFYKFRTMHINMDTTGVHKDYVSDLIGDDRPMVKMDSGNDKRIFKGARILRKTSIDELPQLFNVLKGDMSLVGPRPCIPYEAREYLQWHRNRFDILPGMTGLWQVSGKNNLTFKQMIRLDIKYIKRLSPVQDIRILFKTIPTVIDLALEKSKVKLFKKTA
jgi:lipopolysaccharide/colanic/teichoic acid biosynthesis glycosyltransferase